MPVGGDITEITYSHPTKGTGVIFIKAAEDSTFNLGGVRSDDDMNGVDGGGRGIYKLNRQRWSLDVTVSWDMNTGLDLEDLSALAADPLDGTFTVSHINGSIYGGTGRPVGDIAGNGNSSTFPLKLSGSGVLKKLA